MEDALETNLVQLTEEIRSAFSDVPYPGDDKISQAPYPFDEGISDYFRGTGQDGHLVRDLRIHSAALSFFTPEAYHFYLPSFLIAVLEDPDTAD